MRQNTCKAVSEMYTWLRCGEASTHRPDVPSIVECNIRQNDSLAVIESDVEVPILPINGATVQFERHAFRLSDVDWFEVVSETNVFLDGFGVEVSGRRFVERPAFLWDVNVDNLAGLNVIDWAEVQRVSVLQVIDVGPVIHESLLESRAIGESFVVAAIGISSCSHRSKWSALRLFLRDLPNGPRVAVDFVHVFRRNAQHATLLNDLGILPHNIFDGFEIFHGDSRIDTFGLFPANNGL